MVVEEREGDEGAEGHVHGVVCHGGSLGLVDGLGEASGSWCC